MDRIDRLESWHAIYDLLCDYMRGQDRLDPVLHRSVFPRRCDDRLRRGVSWRRRWLRRLRARRADAAQGQSSHDRAGADRLRRHRHRVRRGLFPGVPPRRRGRHVETDLFVSGRYIDRYERRGGVWKIAHRSELVDWVRSEPAIDDPWSGAPRFPMGDTRARRSQLPTRGDAGAMTKIAVEEVADRLAIQDVLYRYARGIDRCDEVVLRGVWWPGRACGLWEWRGRRRRLVRRCRQGALRDAADAALSRQRVNFG